MIYLVGDVTLNVDSDNDGLAVLVPTTDPFAVGILHQLRNICVAKLRQVLTRVFHREGISDGGARRCGGRLWCRLRGSIAGDCGKGQGGDKNRGQRKYASPLESSFCLNMQRARRATSLDDVDLGRQVGRDL